MPLCYTYRLKHLTNALLITSEEKVYAVFKTLATIIKDNWQWRRQIRRLAVFELIKKSRGAVLSWAWLFVKPLVFIGVFWFALDIGLRAGRDMDPPYFLWLITGIIPWFFMRDMLGQGSDILHRYTYLVKRIKFPLSGISSIYVLSMLIIHLGLVVIMAVIYYVSGVPFDIHLLQIPILIIVMVVFFTMFSIMTSLISALSKDFKNLIAALVTPLFWLSGVIFNVASLPVAWIKVALLLNPVTFFATAYRDAFYYKVWVWENPHSLIAFAAVFVVTLIAMLLVYKRLHKEVPDVL